MIRRDALLSFATGPVPAYPAVLRAMSAAIPYDHDPAFRDFFHALTQRAARALRCATPPVILQMEAAPGLEACVASLAGPDDVVLCLASGPYGAALGALARRHAREVIDLRVPGGCAVRVDDVARLLHERRDITLVTIVHHETPWGTLNPVTAIAAAARAAGAVVLADAVSSFGGMAVDAASSGADVFVTSPGKCLGGTPGVTLVAATEAAWDKIARNRAAPRGSVLSLLDWRDAWQPDNPFPFTPSVAELHGLAAALDLYLTEGPEAVWERHAASAAAFRAGGLAIGFGFWPSEPAIAAPTVTVVRLPQGARPETILAEARAMGVVFAPSRGDMAQTLRVGHMGPMAEPLHAATAACVLAEALRRSGLDCDVGAAAAAAFAACRPGARGQRASDVAG